ncbi:T9SS type A sorting domain-containing protein [Winogradskyella haliclonae]|uniref:T9SS C-terminal target domain-containing protein n=1 Tax=Winogradskyella haliclonae TaxID=2048558 RepID=A0ABQ2BZI5_9FLAO|nr:T9SS type A sorting domain-containing protein [Winogradskyella haliclonae]GGI57919.1 T9SS C-terminal target domain-containing protein [Winogradskyella haliclonae]
MKKITLLCFLIATSFAFSQNNWTTGEVNLDGGNFSVQFDINGNTNVVTMTMKGPVGVWLAVAPNVGANNTMGNANDDCIVFNNNGLEDRFMQGFTGQPVLDNSSDSDDEWTLEQNTDDGTVRTVVATRAINTGDSQDFVFPENTQASFPILWAKGNGTLGFGYHGNLASGNRGGTVASIVLSNEDFQLNPARFTISPNPSTNDLNIGILYDASRDYNLEVYDVLGKQIYRGQLIKDDSTIDVRSWRRGVYLVKLSSDQSTQTKRFIKQ